MKKYIVIIALAVFSFVSCVKELGPTPGNDTEPYALVGTSAPSGDYDPDCDVAIRFTCNNATQELYYFIEPTETKEARNLTQEAYADYVIQNGTKLSPVSSEFDGSKTQDIVSQQVYGPNTISAVAVGNGKKYLASASFTGIKWSTLATGTFTCGKANVTKLSSKKTVLQKNEQEEGMYRFPNLFKDGYHYVFYTVGNAKKDSDGSVYYNVTMPGQLIGLTYGSNGDISVRDVATWQSEESYQAYNTYYPEDNYVSIWAQYYVNDGSLGYADDVFEADE